MIFGGIEVAGTCIHETADGKKMLIIHGDQYDIVVRHARWIAILGNWAYEFAIFFNTWFNHTRRLFGIGYWSFSAWAKHKVKKAVNFIGDFERTLAAEAAKAGLDGVICGHIHHPSIREIDGLYYVNTGDFVESCSAVAEHGDGRFEIIWWRKMVSEK
jgi:UDP-2,3-diacylglucosamine pyrophosphatase LpxH